jgi:CheY-like chemotaxis protein
LFITKGLVEKHGGTINLISEGQNKGCTAIIELPLYENPTRARSSSVDSTRSSSSILHSPRKKYECPTSSHRCLVVDDSNPNRKILVRLLERSGHVCLSACHGQEAIEIMNADMVCANDDENHVPIDTIFMDYEMPILNGPNATKVLRDSGCNATIIGVTGNLLTEDVNYFVSMGADKVLPKPVSMVSIQESWNNLGLARSV